MHRFWLFSTGFFVVCRISTMVKKGLFGRTRRSTSKRANRAKGERGAALIEFALIAPLFFTVVFGGIEIGLMFRSYLALEDMTRATARIASVERDSADADMRILEFIANRAAPLQGDVTRVVIFNADTLEAGVPQNCIDSDTGAGASRSGICQSYNVVDGDVSAVAAGPAENGWPSSQRDAFDNIGIYVEYDYQYATGFFDTLTLSSTTIEVIELDL